MLEFFPMPMKKGHFRKDSLTRCRKRRKRKGKNTSWRFRRKLSAEIQKKYIGRTEPVLIEGLSSETDLLLQGRTRYQAPEVDGCVLINDGVASPGDVVSVTITDAQVYDLVGGIAVGQQPCVFR